MANDVVGRSVKHFALEIGSARATLYRLPPELQPRSIKLGRRRIVIEQPLDYLKRVGASSTCGHK